MINPFLVDMIERVTRDTERKLGWNDRLVGTMRVALEQGIKPNRYAFGAAAAFVHLEPIILEGKTTAGNILDELWQEDSPNQFERNQLVALIETALEKLRAWHAAGFPDLEIFYNQINK
jgi:mannitol-1-phosphate/altronate dehydrogenase